MKKQKRFRSSPDNPLILKHYQFPKSIVEVLEEESRMIGKGVQRILAEVVEKHFKKRLKERTTT